MCISIIGNMFYRLEGRMATFDMGKDTFCFSSPDRDLIRSQVEANSCDVIFALVRDSIRSGKY